MDKKKQMAIEHHYSDLMKSMDPILVMDHLSADLLSSAKKESIKESHSTRRDRNRELISILSRKREDLNPLEHFIKALKKTDASHEIMAKGIIKTYTHDIGAHKVEKASRTSLPDKGDIEYDLQSVQQSLKEMFLTRFKNIYPFSLPFTFDIENTWVSLALKEYKKKFDAAGNFIHRSQRSLRTLEDDMKNSQATEDNAELLKRVFDKVNMLIIEGDPATGKTSLMRRLAYEWGNGKQELLHYDLVLYAEFRELHEKTFQSIAELVLYYYSKTLLNKESYKKLEILMNNEQFSKEGRILVLLDGYDESSLEKQCSEFSSYIKEKTIDKQLLFDTVITTRKGFLSDLRGRDGRFVFAEVLGFTTKQQKEKYIYNHFHSSETDNKHNIAAVHSLLDNNENLDTLAETPLFLTFICMVYERIVDGTLLELYCNIICWLINRHQQDFPHRDIPVLFGFQNGCSDKFETIQDHYLHFPQLYCLGKMALHNLEENVFEPSDYAQFDLQPIIEQVELLRTEKKHDKSFKLVTSYFFPHRTIQEFLAAFYCFCSNDIISEWLLPDSKLDTSKVGMNEFERFLFRIALSDKMPIKAEKRKYYFERITDIDLDMTFDAFNTTAGFNNDLLNWFLSQSTNVQKITLNGVYRASHEWNMLNDTSVHNESAIASNTSRSTLISFSDLSKLHSLTFFGCAFIANSRLSFRNCRSLKNLRFRECEMERSTIVGIAALPAIDTVQFDECNIDMATWESITDQISNSNIKYLRLSADFFVKESCPKFLHHLQKCASIQQITVMNVIEHDYLDDYHISVLNRHDGLATANLALTAEILPALTSIILPEFVRDSLTRERIERAGQQRNPHFSIKHVEEPITSRKSKRGKCNII